MWPTIKTQKIKRKIEHGNIMFKLITWLRVLALLLVDIDRNRKTGSDEIRGH